MSRQRSDWRERLHANPSRMEQELAISLQQDQIYHRLRFSQSVCGETEGTLSRLSAKCRFCGQRAAIEIRGKGPHQGEYCSNCGHWLRWIPKKVARKRVGS